MSEPLANVRDSDTSLWLHNKLGTSNDSWTSGSICSQLNKEVLRNIKECFPDLQTQVKLKLLLSFFHIPRRLVEEWKTELEEIIEVAGLDTELWVSMVAETMKTFPSSGSLNTEISDYEETRPIFTDMVNDLRKLVSKHSDLGMLPLECQYLNKNAFTSVVGQQPNPVKHFTLKRKPKSANLRTELLQKSADAQSSLKKASAPTIPLRSRGMPRKMTDTTPLKGIPSRVPTSGFRSPTSLQSQNRPNISRTPAGRKDGGIKLIEFTEQPLGYAAAKKRKRQQEIEEQQKKAMESKQATSTTTSPSTPTTTTISTTPTTPTPTTPDYAAGLTSTTAYTTQPSTPVSLHQTIKEEKLCKTSISAGLSNNQNSFTNNVQNISNTMVTTQVQSQSISSDTVIKEETKPLKVEDAVKKEIEDIKPDIISTAKPSVVTNLAASAVATNANTTIITTSKAISASEGSSNIISKSSPMSIVVNSSSPMKFSSPILKPSIASTSQQTQTNTISTPVSISKSTGPVIISQTIIQPAKQPRSQQTQQQQQQQQTIPLSTGVVSTPIVTSLPVSYTQTIPNHQQSAAPTQIILTSTPSSVSIPSLTSFAQARPVHTIIQTPMSSQQQSQQVQTQPTKILLKTAPTIPLVMSNTSRASSIQTNPPPLISTQPTILNLQNVNLPNRPVTIQPASQAAQAQHIQAQLQQQQQQQQQQQHTIVTNTAPTEQPKFAQVVMSPGMNVKGKTFILAQKGVILRSVGGDVYQQIPIANTSQIGNLGGATIVTAGPQIVKTSTTPQTITTQQPTIKQATQQIPALIPTNAITQNVSVPSLAPVVIASHNVQQQSQPQPVQTIIGNPPQQTIIRPVLTTNVQGGIATLPQGLTLIQRPGQQPQLVQVQTTPAQPQQQQIQRTIITQQPQTTQIRPQQIIIQHKPQTIITTQQIQQQQQIQQTQQQQQQPNQQTQTIQPQRKGLSLSNEHIIKAHEMFRKANRVSRPDKALILGFMAGLRENPRPNPENVIVIKLGETEEKVKQEDDTYALMLVESLIRLDYNTGEWKTFQNYRRIDQSTQNQQTGTTGNDSKLTQTQNSVII